MSETATDELAFDFLREMHIGKNRKKNMYCYTDATKRVIKMLLDVVGTFFVLFDSIDFALIKDFIWILRKEITPKKTSLSASAFTLPNKKGRKTLHNLLTSYSKNVHVQFLNEDRLDCRRNNMIPMKSFIPQIDATLNWDVWRPLRRFHGKDMNLWRYQDESMQVITMQFGGFYKTRIGECLFDSSDLNQIQLYPWIEHESPLECKGEGDYTSYVIRQTGNKSDPDSFFLHNYLLGVKKVDHINRNGLDNRRCNIRAITTKGNSMNTRMRYNNKTGKTGVEQPNGTKWYVVRWIDNNGVKHKKSFNFGPRSKKRWTQQQAYDKAVAFRTEMDIKYKNANGYDVDKVPFSLVESEEPKIEDEDIDVEEEQQINKNKNESNGIENEIEMIA